MYRLSERVVEFLVQHGLEEFLVDPDLRHDLRRRSRTHTPADRRPGAWSA
jgi:hypothetical protein